MPEALDAVIISTAIVVMASVVGILINNATFDRVDTSLDDSIKHIETTFGGA